ncbi:hypothetical protein [Streptomyces sp. bgisy027]|uniref:hypothetical protein n=1 Tax=Streptomyces sp. bgisy027 TaxID=3413770 RepID=UPI003D74CB29
MAAVWTTARTDTRLAVALAGRDPGAPEEAGRAARSDYQAGPLLGCRVAYPVGGELEQRSRFGQDVRHVRASSEEEVLASPYARAQE